MLKYFKTIGVLAISALLITSCSGPGEVHEYSVTDLSLVLKVHYLLDPIVVKLRFPSI